MCDPVAASFGLNAIGAISQHAAQTQAVNARNRARLRNFQLANDQYLVEVMLDENKYKNDSQQEDIEQDQVYRAMVDQWTQQDQALDRLFNDGNTQIQQRLINMHKRGYAGEGSGVTAGRLASQSAREFGHAKAQILSKLMLSQESTDINKEILRQQAKTDSMKLYNQVRLAPIHGPTPIAPELEAKPSAASLILGLASAGLQSYGLSKTLNPPPVGGIETANTGFSSAELGTSATINSGGFIETTIDSGGIRKSIHHAASANPFGI